MPYQNVGIPWIADLRDSWLDLPHLDRNRFSVKCKSYLLTSYARRIFRNVSALITVSDPIRDKLQKRYPDTPCFTIPNGFEPDDILRASQKPMGFIERDRFTISYTGNFFGKQSPQGLLDAIELAVEQNPSLQNDLLIRFGVKQRDIQRISNDPILSEVIEQVGFVRHDDVLAYQRSSEALFIFIADGAGSEGVFTGKVFEYLAAHRPIIMETPAKMLRLA